MLLITHKTKQTEFHMKRYDKIIKKSSNFYEDFELPCNKDMSVFLQKPDIRYILLHQPRTSVIWGTTRLCLYLGVNMCNE